MPVENVEYVDFERKDPDAVPCRHRDKVGAIVITLPVIRIERYLTENELQAGALDVGYLYRKARQERRNRERGR